MPAAAQAAWRWRWPLGLVRMKLENGSVEPFAWISCSCTILEAPTALTPCTLSSSPALNWNLSNFFEFHSCTLSKANPAAAYSPSRIQTWNKRVKCSRYSSSCLAESIFLLEKNMTSKVGQQRKKLIQSRWLCFRGRFQSLRLGSQTALDIFGSELCLKLCSPVFWTQGCHKCTRKWVTLEVKLHQTRRPIWEFQHRDNSKDDLTSTWSTTVSHFRRSAHETVLSRRIQKTSSDSLPYRHCKCTYSNDRAEGWSFAVTYRNGSNSLFKVQTQKSTPEDQAKLYFRGLFATT